MLERGNIEIQTLVPFLDLLRCPVSRSALTIADGGLRSASNDHYALWENTIPLFAKAHCSAEGRLQQSHYDHIAAAYSANLGYPHTMEYMAYLDRVLDEALETEKLGVCAEICCGCGEAMTLYGDRMERGIGVDISLEMLKRAQARHRSPNILFAQGDATMLPLASQAFDHVFMLGGVHHVNDRTNLFSEVARILKPGGRFVYREPVSDFWLWRSLRSIIYKIAPALDHETERPLRYPETVPILSAVGLTTELWKTYGFLGFCIFMNSDVLVFNRLFRFVPGIRTIVRNATRMDEFMLSLPGFAGCGLQVVGRAVKTEA